MFDDLAFNRFLVCAGPGDKVAIQCSPGCPISRSQALNLAAWLAAVADPAGVEFEKVLTAVRSI